VPQRIDAVYQKRTSYRPPISWREWNGVDCGCGSRVSM
jgi:hypothetical protein